MLKNEGIPYYIDKKLFPATFTVNGLTTSFIVISPQFVSVPTPLQVKDVLDYAVKTYRVDAARIYVTGYSVGGDAAWKLPYNFAAAYRLAALAPVAGYLNPYVDTTAQFIASANLPVWAVHSTSDVTIPISASQNMVNKINSFNPLTLAVLNRLTGPSHDSTVIYAYNPLTKFNSKNMYEWFLQYSRNYPPIAKAGNDITITFPTTSTSLSGSTSSDPENGPLTYNWTKLNGPSKYSINNATAANPIVSDLVAGVYNFKLEVTDNNLLTATDTVKVTVINPNPNLLPVAQSGED
jgi:hypothetical protein